MTTHPPTPEHLRVVAYRDPRVEARGHRPGSPYIEAVYVGVLGPSATWLWQRLARTATLSPTTELDTLELAADLGLGQGLAANAPPPRAPSTGSSTSTPPYATTTPWPSASPSPTSPPPVSPASPPPPASPTTTSPPTDHRRPNRRPPTR